MQIMKVTTVNPGLTLGEWHSYEPRSTSEQCGMELFSLRTIN